MLLREENAVVEVGWRPEGFLEVTALGCLRPGKRRRIAVAWLSARRGGLVHGHAVGLSRVIRLPSGVPPRSGDRLLVRLSRRATRQPPSPGYVPRGRNWEAFSASIRLVLP